MARADVQLAAVVADERAVVVPQHLDAGQLVEVARQVPRGAGVGDLDGDLADRGVATEVDRDDVADQPVVLRDHRRDGGELPGAMRDLHAIGHVEGHPGRERIAGCQS